MENRVRVEIKGPLVFDDPAVELATMANTLTFVCISGSKIHSIVPGYMSDTSIH